MNKMLLASIVAVIVGYIGISIKMIYLRRVKYLEDYKTFLDELIEEISFFRSPIGEFIDRVMEYKRRDFRHTLAEYKESIISNTSLNINGMYIKSKDKEIIQNCLNQIGRTDKNTELFNLKNYKMDANNMLDNARYELRTKGDLISKLGILFGLALLILMI